MPEDIHDINRQSVKYALLKADKYKLGHYKPTPEIELMVLSDIKAARIAARQLGDKESIRVLSQALGESVDFTPIIKPRIGPRIITGAKPVRQAYAPDRKVPRRL